MPLSLYNTLGRSLEDFTPLVPGEVGLYTCGPTVYADPHLGNLRTYLFEDALKRVLLANNYRVKHVMNITDVGHLTSDADEGEDKMEKGSRTTGKSVWDIATEYTEVFKKNLADLNILPPDIWCKATDHITEQIILIKVLEVKDFTYQIKDGIYFDTAKLSNYGKLALLDIAGLKAGARVEMNPEKRNPTDFALWKFSPQPLAGGATRQMEWPSPWGTGFPGWHIECSAMSVKYLGETFDIHCGGIDHIPVHHTNEIAQSEAATGKPLARYWLHGEFLIDGEKRMGKSEGNAMTLAWLTQQGISPLAYRYFCLGTHYRQKLNFNLDAVAGAQRALEHVQEKVATLGEPEGSVPELEQKFMAAVSDDLNMPQALAVLWELLKGTYPDSAKKASALFMDKVLGLGLANIASIVVPPEVLSLLAEREQARQNKDFAKADDIRTYVKERGFVIDDTEFGPVVKKLK